MSDIPHIVNSFRKNCYTCKHFSFTPTDTELHGTDFKCDKFHEHQGHGIKMLSEGYRLVHKECNEMKPITYSPCTGCYNSEDGHPVGEYPFDKEKGCLVGAGCDECKQTGLRGDIH